MKLAIAAPRLARLAAGYGILFLINGCFFTWSVLALSFSEQFPQWTSAQLALNSTIYISVSAFPGLLVPRVLQHMSHRRAIQLSGILFAAGWLCVCLLQWLPNIALLYLGFGLIGYGTGHIYPIIGQVLTAWFPDRAGAVSGGLLLVTGVGSLLVGELEQLLVGHIGLFGLCACFAALFGGVSVLCGHWMTMPGIWCARSGREQGQQARGQLGDALHTPLFWSFFLWLIFLAAVGLLVINNAANIFADFGAPAQAGMFIMLMTGAGCEGMGLSIDRFGLRASMLGSSLFALFSCALLLAGLAVDGMGLVLAGVLCSGIAYGSTTSAKMAGTVRLYGNRCLTAFFGVLNLNVLPASFLGPYVSGQLQSLGRGYASSFWFMTALAGVSLLLAAAGWRALAPSREQAEAG